MKQIKYRMTWCEYLDKCPYGHMDAMVGDWECHQCPKFVGDYNGKDGRYVECNGE